MNIDPSVLAALPDDLELTFRLTVGELRRLYEGARTPDAEPDLTVEDIATKEKRAVSTVRAWCAAGEFPGAYKLNGVDWRIPVKGYASFRAAKALGVGRGKRRGGRVQGAKRGRAKLGGWREELLDEDVPRRTGTEG